MSSSTGSTTTTTMTNGGTSECLFNDQVPLYVRSTHPVGTGTFFSNPPTTDFIRTPFHIPSSQPPLAPPPLQSQSQTQQFSYNSQTTHRLNNISVELFIVTNSTNGRRSLEVRLVDPGDPFFLWTCQISEEDFLHLKREQNLLIEYNTFPYKLVELLQQCLLQSKEVNPSFTASLMVPDVAGHPASLSITECTSFRQINHLTLRFLPPAEPQFRRHIGDILHRYKDEITYLRSGNSAPSSIPFIPTQQSQQQHHHQQWPHYGKGMSSAPAPAPASAPPTTMSSNMIDIDRANDVIRKLQDELKTLRSNHKMTENSLKQYEKLSKEHRQQGDSLREELKEAEKKLLKAKTETERFKVDNEAMKQELEDSRRLVEANEKVIEWLHQQINEDSLNRVIGKPTGTFNYRPPKNNNKHDVSTSNAKKSGGGSDWIPEWMGPSKTMSTATTAATSSTSPSSSSSIENF